MAKGAKGKKGRKKKLSAEELAFQQIQQEIRPVFDLYDADKDGYLTLREFPHFMKAVAAPLTDELLENAELAFQHIDINAAAEFVREVRDNMHPADRMKEEFFAILNPTAEWVGPVQDLRVLYNLLCQGEFKLQPKEIKWLIKHVKKNQLSDLQKKLIGEGKSPEEIKAAMDELSKTETTDAREIIKVMNYSIQTGTCLLPDDEKERRRKEEASRKEKERKEREKALAAKKK